MYEVDHIIDHTDKDGHIKYYIKWKGYGVKDASWVAEGDINDPQPVERYFKLLLAKDQVRKKQKHR